MREQGGTDIASVAGRYVRKNWRIVLGICLILSVLSYVLYDNRHQIHQTVKALIIPAAQPVHITPLALTPGSRASSTPVPLTSSDWPTYHQNSARAGLAAGVPNPASLQDLWRMRLDGAVYAEPLVVGGEVIVATENDSVYALDGETGNILWRTNLGHPVPLADLPCGDIDPLGITSTPVYDPATGLVFVVAEIRGPAHMLAGLNVSTGQVEVRRLVDPPGIDPRAYQQRDALALYGGRVYIAYGGLYGDCGDYLGTVVAARTNGTGPLLTYQVPTPNRGGIWEPSGPAIDAEGNLYVSVGNGAATGGDWDHADSVLKLSPDLHLEDAFAPKSWARENADDLSLGSMGPVLLPDGLLFIQGKSNQGYLLRADHLGGVGGQIQTLSVCGAGAYGGAAIEGSAAFIPCADGLREISLEPEAESLVMGWRAESQVTGSPVIGGNTVYSLDPGSGVLYALNAATGSVRATASVGATSRFATPTLFYSTVFVGTLTGIVAVRIVT
jgi:outer membrane protein assembly factor BamB